MRLLSATTFASIVTCGFLACDSQDGQPSVPPQNQGGAVTTATGGAVTTSTGGKAAGGATTSSGGTAAATMKGGSTSIGGATGKGGNTSTGGSTGKGGSTSTGGSIGKGGTTTSGGTTARGGTTSTGGTATGGTPATPVGQDGWATRYWDCCKPTCGWSTHTNGKTPIASCSKENTRIGDKDAQSACNGGPAYMCWDYAPWKASETLSYGFAAYNGAPCGTCFQLMFTGKTQNGNAASCAPLLGKTLVVQVINTGGIGSGQFDLLVPGGGVGDFNACSNQWGSSDLGAQYGGFLLGCNGSKSCVETKCSTIFAGKPALLAGCTWFTGWFNAADNPQLKYQQVPCPSAITSKSGMSG